MVKLTLLFTEMLPFEKVRLRLNGSSPAPSLSTISIDVYVDEGEGRPGKVPHASLPWPRLDLLDFAPLGVADLSSGFKAFGKVAATS